MPTNTLRCSVKHREGSDAQRQCPVHGTYAAASTAAALGVVPNAAQMITSGSGRFVSDESSVPGYAPSSFNATKEGGFWEDAEGRPHRLDGPATSSQEEDRNGAYITFGWAIDGRSVDMSEVYGRWVEAMSDGAVPSTSLVTVQDMMWQRVIEVDPDSKRISIASQQGFDRYVDNFMRTTSAAARDKSVPRRIRRAGIETDLRGSTEDYDEWVDGDWRRDRRFGKAIVTDDTDVAMYWWKGESMSMSRLMAMSLNDITDGRISMDNRDAIEFACENATLDEGGHLGLRGYESYPWNRLADAILAKFPNPEPGTEQVALHYDAPGKPQSFTWVKDGAPVPREDGPVNGWISTDGEEREPRSLVYAIDRSRATEEEFLSHMIRERTGVSIDPDNSDALGRLWDSGAITRGDWKTGYRITLSDDVADQAQLSALMNPDR